MKKTLLAVAASLAVASMTVSAAVDHTAPYVFGGVGFGDWNLSHTPSGATTAGVTGQIGGGYLFQPQATPNMGFGAEISGTYYPPITSSGSLTVPGFGTFSGSTTVTNWSVNVLGVAKYFVSEDWNVGVKLGPSFLQTNFTGNLNGASLPSQSISTLGFMMDASLGWNLTPALTLTGDFGYGFFTPSLDASSYGSMNPYAITVGLNYAFLNEK